VLIGHMPGLMDGIEFVMESLLAKDNGNNFFIAMQGQRNTFKWNILHVKGVRCIHAVYLKRHNPAPIIPSEIFKKRAPVVRLYVG